MTEYPVLLEIRGMQHGEDDEPQAIELTTEGTMAKADDHYSISYPESALTGLEGVTTTFDVWPTRVVLTRTGSLNSRMVFEQGYLDSSLYDVGFGALLLEVKASRVDVHLTDEGGSFHIDYRVTIDKNATGRISYHIQVKKQ